MVDMATALETLKIDYRDGVVTDINLLSPIFQLFRRDIDLTRQEADTHRLLIKISPGQNWRVTGTRLPNEFPRTDGAPIWRQVDVTYKSMANPVRVSHNVVVRANGGDAAMIRVLAEALKDLGVQHAARVDWQLSGGTGNGLLFVANAAPVGATLAIRDYCGVAGWQLGTILDLLNLQDAFVNIADNVIMNSAFETVRNGGIASRITTWVSTLGAEVLTFAAAPAGVVADDVIYFSREDRLPLGSQGTNDGLRGIPAAIDNFVRADPYQTIDSTDDTARSFRSVVDTTGGALAETQLLNLRTQCALRGGGAPNEKRTPRHVWIVNEMIRDQFAQGLTTRTATMGTDSNRRVMHNVTEKGFKPHFGPEFDALHYAGIPFATGHLVSRNECYLTDLEALEIVAPSSPEGDFMEPAGGGPNNIRIPGGTQTEFVWEAHLELIARRRNTMGVARSLTSPTGF